MLGRCSTGFGLLALQDMMGSPSQSLAKSARNPKAKSVIFGYMSGGVSQVDSFDPKPELRKYAGKPMPVKIERTQFNRNGNTCFIIGLYQEDEQQGNRLLNKDKEFTVNSN